MNGQPFVEGSVFARIARVIDLAAGIGDNGAIRGAAGVGETAALKEYAARRPGTLYVELTETTGASMRAVYRSICEQFRLELASSLAETEIRLLRWLPKNSVVIIDEAQNLPANAYRQVLNFRDQASVTVILCGNDNTLRRGRTDKADFAQVDSRVGLRATIDGIEDADADAITNTFGVEGLDVYRTMRSVGREHHARGIVRVLSAAKRLSGDAKTITATHIAATADAFPQYRGALR